MTSRTRAAPVITTTPEAFQAVKDAVDTAKLPVLEAQIKAAANEIHLEGSKLASFLKLLDALKTTTMPRTSGTTRIMKKLRIRLGIAKCRPQADAMDGAQC